MMGRAFYSLQITQMTTIINSVFLKINIMNGTNKKYKYEKYCEITPSINIKVH
jgi:hypothetical protein